MATYDERLSALEHTLTALQRDEAISRDELNRNETMLLGMVTAQQLDIKEIKIRLRSIDDRLDNVDGRLDTIDGRLNTIDRRLISMEGKFEQVVQMLTILTRKTNE